MTHSRAKILAAVLPGILTASLWAAPTAYADSPPPQAITLQPCHVDNYRQEVQCGTLTVFEDRDAAQGRTLDIQVVVLPAVNDAKEPDPIVFFAGGPGQAAGDWAAMIRNIFKDVASTRDIVLIDQRGMGRSAALSCENPDEDLSEADHLGLEEVLGLGREMMERCADELSRDHDLKLYTQDLANADIHDVLRALGYDKVNLFGISWGTRSALLYAHRYPENTRTVILDGNLPLDNRAPLHAAEDGDAALMAMFDDCAADTECAAAFPDLASDFRRALERIGDGVEVDLPDPVTGEPRSFELTRERFGDALRTALYNADFSRLLPVLIHKTAEGDFRPFVGLTNLGGSMSSSMTIGATLAIFCAEEFGRMSPEEKEAALAEERKIGVQMFRNLQNACSVWPSAKVPSIYSEDVRPAAPTLVLSGAVDPITPPRWGERMAEALPNALHLTAPFTGHNVAPYGCAPKLLKQFIEQGTYEGIDGTCLDELRRPSFFVDTYGPAVPRKETAGTDGLPDEAGDSDAETTTKSGIEGDAQ